MRIAILGPLEVRRDGGVTRPAGRRVAALLARLALDCGRVVRSSALIDAVWEEQEALAHPSVELLADRGAAASPGFAVTDGNVEAVVEICRRLAGSRSPSSSRPRGCARWPPSRSPRG